MYIFFKKRSVLETFENYRIFFKDFNHNFLKNWYNISVAAFRCVKSVRIRSYSRQQFPEFGLNMERYKLSLRIQSEFGKMRTTITQNRDTFHAMFLVNGKLVDLSTCFWKIMSSRFCLVDVCDRAKIFVPPRDVSTHGGQPAYWFVRDLRNERIKNISQIFHHLKYSIKYGIF